MKKTAKKQRLLGSAMVLAAGTVVAKFLGALYRIPLTNILGAEGMGMYQLVFPVFALFTVLSSAGIPTALSRIVAEKRSQGLDARKYLTSALMVLLAFAVLFTILILALSAPLARWQGNPAVAEGYRVIAPAVLFISIIAGLRGWFQGQMYMLPTAVSNVVEQAVKLAVGIGLAVYMSRMGLLAAVCGALIGITVSEVLTAAYLGAVYFYRERKKGEGARGSSMTREEGRAMLKVAAPIALVAVLLPLSNFFDSLIIVNVLKWAGRSTVSATADYGLLSGPVNSLVNMPVVLIMSLAIAIVPSVSSSRVERDIEGVLTKSRLSIKLAYTVGVPSAVFMAVFARQILGVLYPALSGAQLVTASNLLILTAPNILLMSAMQIYVSLLQALDRTVSAVKSIGFAICVKIVLSFVLVRYLGILGAAAASLALGTVALGLCNIAFLKLTSLRLNNGIGACLAAGVLSALVSVVISEYVGNDIVAIAVGFVVCYLLYTWLIMLFGVYMKEEFSSLPFGRVFCRLHRIVRFWEYE